MVEEAISFWTEIQRYEDMLAADPRSYCFAPLSELYRKLGLLDDAIYVAKKGCDLHPDYPGAFFALGTAYLDKGLKQEARVALERVIELNPDNFRAQKLLGQLYVEAGEIALAEKALGQVLQQNPDDTESELLLQSIASLTSDTHPEEEILEEAEVIEDLTEEFEEPERQVERQVEVKVERPEGFEESEESEESEFVWAEEPAEAAAQQPSLNPLTTATLAELYVSQGFLGKAIAIYQQLLSVDPGHQPYRLRCSELQAELERQKVVAPAAPPAPLPGPASAQQPPAAPGDPEAELSAWLENIRRRRDGI